MTPLHGKFGLILGAGAAWIGSVGLALRHSAGVLAAPTGEAQLAEHLPLLLVLAGGVAAVWVAVGKAVGLYQAGIAEVQRIVRAELENHTRQESLVQADILRRVAQIERIVDSRGRPPSKPFSVPRKEDK